MDSTNKDKKHSDIQQRKARNRALAATMKALRKVSTTTSTYNEETITPSIKHINAVLQNDIHTKFIARQYAVVDKFPKLCTMQTIIRKRIDGTNIDATFSGTNGVHYNLGDVRIDDTPMQLAHLQINENIIDMVNTNARLIPVNDDYTITRYYTARKGEVDILYIAREEQGFVWNDISDIQTISSEDVSYHDLTVIQPKYGKGQIRIMPFYRDQTGGCNASKELIHTIRSCIRQREAFDAKVTRLKIFTELTEKNKHIVSGYTADVTIQERRANEQNPRTRKLRFTARRYVFLTQPKDTQVQRVTGSYYTEPEALDYVTFNTKESFLTNEET